MKLPHVNMAEGAERFRGLWEDEMFARQGRYCTLCVDSTDPFSNLCVDSTDPFANLRCVAVFREIVAGRYLVCRYN